MESLSGIEETRKGLDAAIVNAPIIEILNQVLELVQSQGKVMGEVRRSVGVPSGKVDKVIQVCDKNEGMLASIHNDIKSQKNGGVLSVNLQLMTYIGVRLK